MTINNVTLNTAIPSTTGKISATDHESKNLQNQLLNERQRLNHISSDSEMSKEEKVKERQEIRRQIAELNRKLRQQQMERKQEAKEAAKEEEEKKILKEEILSESYSKEQPKKAAAKEAKEPIEDISVPIASMNKMLAADSVIQQERIQERVIEQKAGKENILEAEIRLDSLYGTDTERKKEELSDMRREKGMQIGPPDRQETEGESTYQGTKIIFRE